MTDSPERHSRSSATYSRIIAIGRCAGGAPCWLRMPGADTPTPSQTVAFGLNACSDAADIAASGGERNWIGTMPVARSSSGATAEAAPSNVKASVPVASTVHSER